MDRTEVGGAEIAQRPTSPDLGHDTYTADVIEADHSVVELCVALVLVAPRHHALFSGPVDSVQCATSSPSGPMPG